ncbi:MAG TPA: hypothetical protein VGN51_21505 [Acidimicrobiia bacterium]|jgi:hypothetical protein
MPEARVTQVLPRWSAKRRAAVLHALSLVVALVVLLWIDRHQWFSGDEWDFLVRRGVVGHHELGLFEPHNEHWSTLPILLYRALFSVFGVRTYFPYVLVLVVAHLVVAHLLWRIMLRCGVDWLVATAAAAVFMVLGAGWEDLINAFQVTFIASLAFGLLAFLLAADHGPFRRRDAWASAFVVVSLFFSGVGLTMMLVLGLAMLLRRRWKPAALIVAAPALAYLLWYAKWGRHAVSIQQEPLRTSLQKAPEFVWHGLVSAVDRVTGLEGIGAVLLVVLAIWVIRKARPTCPPWPMVLALFVGAPLFLFLIDLRRSGLGIDAAGAPRYSYAVLALLLPAAALAVSALLAPTSMRVVLVLGATAVLLVVGVSTLNDEARNYAQFKQENKHRIIAAAELVRSGAPLLSHTPAPEFDPDLRTEDLQRLERDDQLPGNVRVTEQDQLTAADFLQVSVGPAPAPGATAMATLEGVDGATVSSVGSCAVVTPGSDEPVVVLSFAQPGSVTVATSRSGTLTTQLQLPTPDAPTRGRGQSWPSRGGVAQAVSVSATKPWLRLGVPPEGTTRVCHLAAASNQSSTGTG